MLVPKDEAAQIVKQLVGDLPAEDDYDGDDISNENDLCPHTPSTNADYDGDGIGDECDDEAEPVITQVKTSIDTRSVAINYQNGRPGNKYEYCQATRSRFVIQGKPNSIVEYAISVLHNEDRGFAVFVNGEIAATNGDNKNYYTKENGIEGTSYEIQLDITGRAIVRFDIGARNRGRDKRDNYAKAQFFLLHKKEKSQLISGRTPIITIDVLANDRRCNNGPEEAIYDYADYTLRCPNGCRL